MALVWCIQTESGGLFEIWYDLIYEIHPNSTRPLNGTGSCIQATVYVLTYPLLPFCHREGAQEFYTLENEEHYSLKPFMYIVLVQVCKACLPSFVQAHTWA